MNEAEHAREQQEAYLLEKLRIYQGLLDPTLKKVFGAIAVAKEALIGASKYADGLAKDHPLLLKYQPETVGLYEIVNHGLHPQFIAPILRGRLSNLPLNMQRWVDKVREANPGWFRSFHPETFARDDILAGEGLLTELTAFKDFSKNVAHVLVEIEQWHKHHPGYKAADRADVARTPPRRSYSDPDELPKWDPRS
jgi:hypothetical protein